MIIVLLKVVLAILFLTALYCEVSRNFRDCSWFIVIRAGLMVVPAILFAKIGVLAVAPMIVQLSTLALFIIGGTILYSKLLRCQLRISGFTMKKLGIHEYKVKNLNGQELKHE